LPNRRQGAPDSNDSEKTNCSTQSWGGAVFKVLIKKEKYYEGFSGRMWVHDGSCGRGKI